MRSERSRQNSNLRTHDFPAGTGISHVNADAMSDQWCFRYVRCDINEGSTYGSATTVQTSCERDGTGTVDSPFKSGLSER